MIRYGVIGAGRMGRNHAEQLKLIPEAKITRVYDIAPERAEQFRADFGAEICSGPEQLAESPDVDCVIVTSPTYCHIEGVEAALRAGKAIFCEKALCRTPEDARRILRAAEGYEKIFTVGFVRRHMAKTLLLKKLLDEGTIGRIRYCNLDLSLGLYRRMPGDWFADFELCGGVIVDMLAHHIDLANLFFGQAGRVYAQGLLLDSAQPLPADYAAAVVNYPNGIICNMICSWQRFGRSCEMMEIYGDQGALVLDGSDEITFYPAEGEMRKLDPRNGFAAAKPGEGVNQVNIGNGFYYELLNLTRALSGEPIPLPTVHDAWNSLAVSFAMLESARNGRTAEVEVLP